MPKTWTQAEYDAVMPIGTYMTMLSALPPQVPAGIVCQWEHLGNGQEGGVYLMACDPGQGSQNPQDTVPGTENFHTLTMNEFANHTHSKTGSKTAGTNELYFRVANIATPGTMITTYIKQFPNNRPTKPHENRPLSIVVSIWVRTA